MGGVIGKQITILVPRDMDDETLGQVLGEAQRLIVRFGLPVVVQRPYGVTFQNWQVHIAPVEAAPDATFAVAYDMTDRTMEGAE